MDRAKLEQLLAANAVRPAVETCELDDLGETLQMRRPTRDQAIAAATAAGNDEDFTARAMVGALRYAVLNDDGGLLFKTFAETAAFLNALSDRDAGTLLAKLGELLAPTEGDPEAGKAS